MADSTYNLGHVFWLGGPPCAGKTSLSEVLASRFELDVYHADEAFAAHARRLDPALHPTLTRWCASSWNECWARPVESLVRDAIACCQEHFTLVLEDVLATPADKPLLVEGAALLPRQVAGVLSGRSRAIWVVPAPDFQRGHYSKREWVGAIVGQCDDPEAALRSWVARDAGLARWVAAEAGALGMGLLQIDGSRTLEENAAEVAAYFRLPAHLRARPTR
ncbi:MAG: hypothetical protein M3416_07225 [Acidobacteriota bacterium]|nr:hypothetical protein [Acidobacteriota bacterium]